MKKTKLKAPVISSVVFSKLKDCSIIIRLFYKLPRIEKIRCFLEHPLFDGGSRKTAYCKCWSAGEKVHKSDTISNSDMNALTRQSPAPYEKQI